jgi:LysR family transcriptional regulator, glycine cleavage system transcriptional activator
MAMRRLPPLNAIKAFEAAARHGSFTRAAVELCVTHGAVSRQIQALEEWLGVKLFVRTSRNAVATEAGAALLNETGPALDRLAAAAQRVRERRFQQSLRVAALPTFAMRWLIPRLPSFQRDHPEIDVRLITASTAAEQFEMDADIVLSGPARRPGWMGERFMGEARLPLVSADLMARRPLRRPADLARHTLLHSETLRDAWPRWLAAVGLSDLAPEREQVFEHFYFAIQAALDGLGVMMGPIALVGKELQSGRLVMPWPEPALRSKGYFMYMPQPRRDAPAVIALRQWLLDAGQATEAQYPTYLAARRGNRSTGRKVMP